MMKRIVVLAAFLISMLFGYQVDELAAQVKAPIAPCQWQKVLAPVEVRFPVQMDMHAAYAIYAFETDGSIAFNIAGQFPYAAFLSYTTYDVKALLFAALLDKDIRADTGSTNPFYAGQPVNAPNRSYNIKVLPYSTMATPVNAIYMPPIPTGSTSTMVILVMRVYLPEPGNSPDNRTGNIPLPTITAVKASDLKTPVACPKPTGPPEFGGFANYSPAPSPELGKISFYRPPVSMVPFADGSQQLKLGDCTNYLMASLNADKLAVIRFKQIPSFFNNTKTDASTTFSVMQVRYLSLGSYGASPIPPLNSKMQGNIAGPDIVKTSGGGATFLIFPQSIPADKLTAVIKLASLKGYNLIPMADKGAETGPFLIYRNKVATPDYPGAISGVPCFNENKPFNQASIKYAASPDNMKEYAPTGVECTADEFLSGKCGQ